MGRLMETDLFGKIATRPSPPLRSGGPHCNFSSKSVSTMMKERWVMGDQKIENFTFPAGYKQFVLHITFLMKL